MTDDGRAVGVELFEAKVGIGLAEVEEAFGGVFDGGEIFWFEMSITAFVDEDDLRAGGILGESAFEEFLTDDAGGALREEADVVVLGDGVPAWRGEMDDRDEHDPK